MAELPSLAERIDDAALEAGRDPASILRILNASGKITDGVEARAHSMAPSTDGSTRSSRGRARWRIDAFVVWPPDAGSAMVERLAAEVVPAVRTASTRTVPDRGGGRLALTALVRSGVVPVTESLRQPRCPVGRA